MSISQKHAVWRFLPCMIALLATVLLAACDVAGTSSSTTTPTSPTVSLAGALRTYTGPDFTIRYPADWKTADSGLVIFADPRAAYVITIGSKSNPDGLGSPEKVIDQSLAGWRNLQPVPTMLSTITLDGQIWSQRAVIGKDIEDGKIVQVEQVLLATNYPVKSADTKMYLIIYSTLPSLFDQASNLYFTPMLRSFAFIV
jgi:hypothetical protein